ncbi:alpha/beta hydrolase-fold protein [Nocardia sp. NBC_00565]|uniref:alpha/beta hydrolase-fold protein n=1 Tax=Nocardia sp. NBC_00565 TaxID=2975993 RepID=UPI002E82143F|nr:alpha/beta hydrolase-fold protein [Nocardia sp. NBC_00565]WUC01837.1 alpha/beta hydrolase-fold protein [Nocardia sp. NBC_00565]
MVAAVGDRSGPRVDAVAAVGLTAPAAAAFNPAGSDFWVDSSMGPTKTRIFRAADGNTRRIVCALDGLRARNDLSGWEIDTEISQVLPRWNINVVMPVGGQSSFYSDWIAPSNTNGQQRAYTWETFLTQNLRWALRDRLGFNPYGNGVFGLSMGGSAALALAAYHPDQFRYAGSYSGYLNISAPGMREGLRLALLDSLASTNAVFDCPAVGTHNWPYWTDQVFKMLPDLSANLG